MLYQETLEKEGLFLLTALRSTRTKDQTAQLETLYEALGAERCFRLATENFTAMAIGDAIANELGVDRLPGIWADAMRENETRVRALLAMTDIFAGKMEDNGCPMAVMEGGSALLTSDQAIRAFGSGDLDILVAPGAMGLAGELLLDSGWHEVNARSRDGNRSANAIPRIRRQFSRQDDNGQTAHLEIADRSFERIWIPLSYVDRSEVWLQRRIQTEKAGEHLATLDPTDALAQVSIHTSCHSYVREPGLRLQIDVDRLVTDNQIDWERYLREIEEMQLQTRAYVSVAMAAGLLGTAIPTHVLESLYPGHARWKQIEGILQRAGVMARQGPKFTKGDSLRLDALLFERSLPVWLKTLVLPPGDWMRERFDTQGAGGDSALRMHLRRIGSMVATRL